MCLKSTSFLKIIFKNNDKIFSELLYNLNKDNEDFTIQSCIEITKYVEDLAVYDDKEILKLFKAIIPILGLKDKFQMQRFEILLGVQQFSFEDSNYRYCFPSFGYHKIGDDNAKLFEFRGTYMNRSTCSFVKKLFSLKNRDSITCELFLCMLEAASENNELLKYMKLLGSEEISNAE